jgi:hypothetical protein
MTKDRILQLTEHLIIRVTKEQRDPLRRTAKSYDHKTTALARRGECQNKANIRTKSNIENNL